MQPLIDEINRVVLKKNIEKLNRSLSQTFIDSAAENPRIVCHGSQSKICNSFGSLSYNSNENTQSD